MDSLQTASVTHKKPVKRLTDTDKAFALKYRTDGLTQVQIAERLGCDQATISRWLAQCDDTTPAAAAYFRGQALRMAEKIVAEGRPADLVKVQQGINVLAEDKAVGLTIQIGIRDSDVAFACSTQALSSVQQVLSGDLGSDNGAYVVTKDAVEKA